MCVQDAHEARAAKGEAVPIEKRQDVEISGVRGGGGRGERRDANEAGGRGGERGGGVEVGECGVAKCRCWRF